MNLKMASRQATAWMPLYHSGEKDETENKTGQKCHVRTGRDSHKPFCNPDAWIFSFVFPGRLL